MTTDLPALCERLRALHAAAAPEPWRPCQAMTSGNGDDCGLIWSLPCDGVVAKAWSQRNMPELGGESFYHEAMIANAQLIAEMRNALPTLLAAVERATLATQVAEAVAAWSDDDGYEPLVWSHDQVRAALTAWRAARDARYCENNAGIYSSPRGKPRCVAARDGAGE